MKETWTENTPALQMTLLENGCIRLEDAAFSPDAIVDVHPIHLRLMAEKLGLAREMTAQEADAERKVPRLERRLKVLHDRIQQLDQWLWDHPDHENADITTEIWFSSATVELSTEFQTEVAESRTVARMVKDEYVRTIRGESARSDGSPKDAPKSPLGDGSPAETQRVPAQMEIAT